jgi:positive regulator of sigma E activity
MIALIPLLVALIGLLLWLLAGNPVLKEIGKILFIIGAFWTVGGYSGKMTKLF